MVKILSLEKHNMQANILLKVQGGKRSWSMSQDLLGLTKRRIEARSDTMIIIKLFLIHKLEHIYKEVYKLT